jgi:hypothetical protein
LKFAKSGNFGYIHTQNKSGMGRKHCLSGICGLELQNATATAGAVLTEGAKRCGKTGAADHAARSTLSVQNPDHARSCQEMADTKPPLLLKGETPRLTDGWQRSPALWDAVRFEVDKRQLPWRFIRAGSADVPAGNVTAQTGRGRFARILTRTVSGCEINTDKMCVPSFPGWFPQADNTPFAVKTACQPFRSAA